MEDSISPDGLIMTDNLIYCCDSTGAHCICDPSPSLPCRVVFQARDPASAVSGLNPGIHLTLDCISISHHLPAHILVPVSVSCASLTHSPRVLFQTILFTVLVLILGYYTLFLVRVNLLV